MRYGVREICNVVLKKKIAGHFGNLYLDKGMPVLYFDTLKTSSLEGAATTVYAQGGRGNPRLVAWDGDRTVTFTMEDALISPESFSILSGAGFMDASKEEKLYVHTTQQVEIKEGKITLDAVPVKVGVKDEGDMYIMVVNESGIIDTYYLPMKIESDLVNGEANTFAIATLLTEWVTKYNSSHAALIENGVAKEVALPSAETEKARWNPDNVEGLNADKISDPLADGRVVFVDYYVEATTGVKQIEIEADKFGGSYYLEAETLFRDQASGDDFPAEFVIPNCKVQSNFTFTMAPTGRLDCLAA